MDCKKCHLKCKASCCGITPIPRQIFESNKDKIVTEPQEVIYDCGPPIPKTKEEPIDLLTSEEVAIPITETGRCCFLNKDLSCNIYEDRPNVCRRFGDESHINLTCLFMSQDGRIRTRQETRSLYRRSIKNAEAFRKVLTSNKENHFSEN